LAGAAPPRRHYRDDSGPQLGQFGPHSWSARGPAARLDWPAPGCIYFRRGTLEETPGSGQDRRPLPHPSTQLRQAASWVVVVAIVACGCSLASPQLPAPPASARQVPTAVERSPALLGPPCQRDRLRQRRVSGPPPLPIAHCLLTTRPSCCALAVAQPRRPKA
jgi:hypothetical protein